MIELEKTYLAKEIPEGLENCKNLEIIDIYVPKNPKPGEHIAVRVRKRGDNYRITKKTCIDGDHSKLREETIVLSKEEFDVFSKVDGAKVHKIRYYYDYKGRTAEIDVFQEPLKGLVVVEVEFENEKDKDSFEMPEFCLADVTHEDFIAGGMICGKSYEDVQKDLEQLGYKKLFLS